MRSAEYEQGRRNGIKSCVEWLHRRAAEMKDPHAKAILNAAAFNMGSGLRHGTGGATGYGPSVTADQLLEEVKPAPEHDTTERYDLTRDGHPNTALGER